MLSDEEFLVLWENYESKDPDLPWDSHVFLTFKILNDLAP